MIEQTTWIIYRDNGQYMGQYEAFAAQVAFRQYMELQGEAVSAADLQFDPLDDDSVRISYQSDAYIVKPQIHYPIGRPSPDQDIQTNTRL